MTLDAKSRLVFSLDIPDLRSAKMYVDLLRMEVGVFKVGLELFTSAGPAAVDLVHNAGVECFLDLKLHDIPGTMSGAVTSATQLGVRYLTVHAATGPNSLRTAAEFARGTKTKLLAVTVLTSFDDAELYSIGLAGGVEVNAEKLARMANSSGLRGFVCSAHEVSRLRAAFGPDALLVVPGIRPAGSADDDQRRVATPAEAIAAGADLLVVGRPIRSADDPAAAARTIVAQIEIALSKQT